MYESENEMRRILQLPKPAAVSNELLVAKYTIKKRFKLNPLTNRDTPYVCDYYYSQCQADNRCHDNSTDNMKIRATQYVLHNQTNYNDICADLYRQNVAVFDQVINTWYKQLSALNPKYREAFEFERKRHLIAYRLQHGIVWDDKLL
jgi:hypothetical protein